MKRNETHVMNNPVRTLRKVPNMYQSAHLLSTISLPENLKIAFPAIINVKKPNAEEKSLLY